MHEKCNKKKICWFTRVLFLGMFLLCEMNVFNETIFGSKISTQLNLYLNVFN
jgi:hypothetical protein